jgi:hypothetical protein
MEPETSFCFTFHHSGNTASGSGGGLYAVGSNNVQMTM